MAHSSTIISQFLKLVPRHEFNQLVKQHDPKRRSDAFSRWSQFVALGVGQLASRSSLRDIEATMQSQSHLRYHLNCQPVSKSALGRANEKLSADFYLDVFKKLYQRCSQTSPKHPFRFKNKLFSLDASLIDVSMKLFPQANYNTMKAAYKLHLGLDHDGLIPAFAHITHSKQSDLSGAQLMKFPKGSVLVFDRGYNNYSWHNSLTEKGIFYVTRIHSRAVYNVLTHNKVPENTAVTSDQIIAYSSAKAQRNDLMPVRRVGYRDPETGKHYEFITNQLNWSAQTVAEIYKQRWQVELFFKWIKQNLKIKSFLGNSENAVKTQVFAALCIYLILAFIKFRSRVGKSFQQIFRLIQVNLFAKRSLMELLEPPDPGRLLTPQLEMPGI